MSRKTEPILIAAQSGRALARSARAASLPVVVLDIFGDVDMRAYAQAWSRVGDVEAGFDRRLLLDAAWRLAPPGRCAGVVYGSGFESCPDILSELIAERTLFGNTPSVLAEAGSPRRFFPLLERLGIPYPEIRYRRPPCCDGWLAKRAAASGGWHVLPAASLTEQAGYYFQRQASGRVMSVLFLGDGHRASIVGISEQWSAASLESRSYAYGGAVSHQSISPGLRRELARAVGRLVQALELRGLNGMDVVVDDGSFQVLEINARPTATAELYDYESSESLFLLHLRACRGEAVRYQDRGGRMYAHMRIHAPQDLVVPAGLSWPAWCSDRPAAHTRIARGEPVCTVHASGTSRFGLRGFLARRSRFVQEALLPTGLEPATRTARANAGMMAWPH